jgi:general secretion pathway protein A
VDYLYHFQLSEDPFRIDAGEKFDVDLPSQADALARADRAVRTGKSLVVLVGGVGTGKTRIARRLYEALEEEIFEAGMMVVLRRAVGADWLLVRIARQLGVEEPRNEREALIAQIYEKLAIVHEDGRRAVLIVDDAQGLANEETLAELCGLVKLEYEDRRLLTVVLVGAPALAAAITADPLLAHHVDVRVQLAPLERDDAVGYLAARIEAAGGSGETLLPGAAAALHELSEGAPGRMNALADNALYEAWRCQREQVTRNDVEQAYRDLGWDAVRAVRHAYRSGGVQAELTDPLGLAGADLDPELDAVFAAGESHRGGSTAASGMDFDAKPMGRVTGRRDLAEATRIGIEEDVVPGPPPKQAGDEVDDLFMELLDD